MASENSAYDTVHSCTPGFHFHAIADVARRWDITVVEADSFLESVGYYEWSVQTKAEQEGDR